ncbi:hypothetical protein J7K27_06275 [Candidatus Bathyarchaeota archaeon]|nr:hypothetical protein [Candidatus Bathyarchaeota archaeon]
MLKWENRAWEEAEHPRLVSEPVEINGTEFVFCIDYNYVAKQYMLTISETRDFGRGYPETYASFKYFNSIEEAKAYVESFLEEQKRKVRIGLKCKICGRTLPSRSARLMMEHLEREHNGELVDRIEALFFDRVELQ